MAVADEVVLLKSTFQMQNKWYSVKLTPSEIYWESLSVDRMAGGPYSQPLVSTYLTYSVRLQINLVRL